MLGWHNSPREISKYISSIIIKKKFFNFFITPLTFIFITYYYLAKKTLFLKEISYIYFIIFVIDFVLYF